MVVFWTYIVHNEYSQSMNIANMVVSSVASHAIGRNRYAQDRGAYASLHMCDECMIDSNPDTFGWRGHA